MRKAAKAELTRLLTTGRVESTDLIVALGRERFPVVSLEDASRIWRTFVDRIESTTGESGCSQIGNGYRVVNAKNKLVARISYNGRIWPHHNHPSRKEHNMTKPKSTKKAPAKKAAKAESAATTPEPEVVTTASKKAAKAAKKGRERKTPIEEGDLVVFAFRLLPEERDAIHHAAGPAKASKFARAFLVAAARGDEAGLKEMLKGLNAPSK
jgi:hypothetical protein